MKPRVEALETLVSSRVANIEGSFVRKLRDVSPFSCSRYRGQLREEAFETLVPSRVADFEGSGSSVKKTTHFCMKIPRVEKIYIKRITSSLDVWKRSSNY